jgi:gliding-associated putative ABC transporter substrate-binding component GldG
MASKKLSTRTSAYIAGAALVVGLTAVGIVSELYVHQRLDLTSDRQFTLSKAAIQTLNSLPDLVRVKVVMSKDLPTQFIQIRTRVMDLLQEFEAQSNGKLQLSVEDPGDDEKKRQSVTSLGIQEVQLQEQSSEGVQIKKGFFGLALMYGDKKEVIPVLQNLESFEYDLVVKLKKLTGNTKTIGIIEGSGENRWSFTLPGQPPKITTGFEENFPTLKQEIEKLYKIEKLDPSVQEISDNIDLLWVVAPKQLNEVEKYRIDQHIMKGKSVIFMAPGVDVNLGMGINGSATQNGYEDMLSHYGVGVKKNVILEYRQHQFVRFGNSFFPSPYPYWIVVSYEGLNAKSAITSKLGTISLPWTSSIELDSTRRDSANTEILVESTKESWDESNSFSLLPRDMKDYLPINPKKHPLVVMRSGKFASYFDKRPIPADSMNKIDTSKALRQSQKEGRILAFANALFASDFFVGYTNSIGNLHLVLNSLDQLALDPDLITIRSREITDAPINESKKGLKTPLLLFNMLTAPILLLLAGILMYVRRRNKEASA